MVYIVFAIVTTLAYLSGIVVRARELRASTAEARLEKQTVPLIIATTVLWAVVEVKTYQLVQLIILASIEGVTIWTLRWMS